MNAPGHLSVLDLDTWFASPVGERESTGSREIRAHLDSCAQCRQYVETMESDVSRTPAPPRAGAAPRGKVVRLVPAVATVLALAAGLALWVRSRSPADDASYIGVKGTPAAQILVRRDGRVHVWDGAAPVRSGDALAVRVACEAFEHVAIVAESDAGIERVWAGACPGARSDAPLPFTLLVDEKPGREHFTVVLSRERLDDALLGGFVRDSARSDRAWTMAFDFAKEE